MMPFHPAVKLASVWTALLALLVACAQDSEPDKSPAERGALLFAENCSPCHGVAGRGPSLEDDIRALTPEQLRAAIRNHPTAGQIPERLPAARVQDIIDFFESDLPPPE